MSDNKLDIKILDIHWIKDVDDPTDLCAHGHVFVKIGNEVVVNKDSLDVTVSSTALCLMRTLKDDYKKGDYASQLFPCCGHFFMADEENDYVNIMGCPIGIDWTIRLVAIIFTVRTSNTGIAILEYYPTYVSATEKH